MFHSVMNYDFVHREFNCKYLNVLLIAIIKENEIVELFLYKE